MSYNTAIHVFVSCDSHHSLSCFLRRMLAVRWRRTRGRNICGMPAITLPVPTLLRIGTMRRKPCTSPTWQNLSGMVLLVHFFLCKLFCDILIPPPTSPTMAGSSMAGHYFVHLAVLCQYISKGTQALLHETSRFVFAE